MKTSDIQPTQCGFRMIAKERCDLGNFVKFGGRFDHVRPIVIDRFPDGSLFVRDGHHRVVAIHRYRKNSILLEGECVLVDRTYEMYTEPDIIDGWITPFDPRTEIRLAELSEYKSDVMRMIRMGINPMQLILANKHRYSRTRTSLDSFDELALAWK